MSKKILVVGGGTGGHTTPVISVAEEILKQEPKTKISFWTDKKQYKNVCESELGKKIQVKKIIGGKLRRFTNWNFWEYIKHLHVVLQNVWDFVKFGVGFCQSYIGLKKEKPDVVFLKGGYVCLPVGLAAGFLKIPYVIHESDVVPGLTNRLLMKKATKIATGMPVECYNEYQEKMIWTGIPIDDRFRHYNKQEIEAIKTELGFQADRPLIVVTGGSQGAKNLNKAVEEILPSLMSLGAVLLVAGEKNMQEMKDLGRYIGESFNMIGYSDKLWDLFGAATIVVARTGASTLMNLAVAKKAAVLVPNQKLPGSHQVRNAEMFEKAGAGKMLVDKDMIEKPERLFNAVKELIEDEDLRQKMEVAVGKFAKRGATKELAEIILST